MDTITGVPLAKFRMGLWRLGNSSFVLRSRGAPILAIDPVLRVPPLPGTATPPFPPSEFRADIVIITGARPERFDLGTVNKSPSKTQAFFAGPADVCARLESIGIPSSRIGTIEPGKKLDFDGLVVEGRPCAAGREGVSVLVTALESGTRAYFASDPYHEVGTGSADLLAVPIFPGEGCAGGKFTAHVRPRWSVPCPLGPVKDGEQDIMEFTMEAQGGGVGEAVVRMDPILPLLLGDDGKWTKVTGNLIMTWQCGKPAPDVALPPGYKIRKFKKADVPALAAIYARTYGAFYDENWYRKAVMGSYIFSPDRCFVVEQGGKPAATVLAWEDEKHKDIGRGVLYYLATDSAHQHRGLGRACSVAVMNYFKKDGRREVQLVTADFRVNALRTYLGLGFETLEDTEEMKVRWANVRAALEAQG